MNSINVKNIVLVHGAWADGSSWSKIVPLLQAKGYKVACVQHPLTSIADDVAATKRILNTLDGSLFWLAIPMGGHHHRSWRPPKGRRFGLRCGVCSR